MSFQLKADEPVDKGVKRIVREEIDDALELLTSSLGPKQYDAVHDARKRCKKIRAVLRLIRDEIGSRVYRRENESYRDAARSLTELRDAKVLLEGVDNLARHFADHVSSKDFREIREMLQARQREVRKRVLKEEDALSVVAGALQAARKRVKGWRIAHHGWQAVAPGVKRTYRDTSRAFEAAADDPSVENLHEWRKQVKYLRHHFEILGPIWPDVMDELARQAHQLTDYLGDDHDLAMLRKTVSEPCDRVTDRSAVETLIALVDLRRGELQEQAAALGQRLFCDKPRVFTRRLQTFWHAWRSEGKKCEVC